VEKASAGKLNRSETDMGKFLDITHPENILIVAGVSLVLNLCSALLIHGVPTRFSTPLASIDPFFVQIIVTTIYIQTKNGQVNKGLYVAIPKLWSDNPSQVS